MNNVKALKPDTGNWMIEAALERNPREFLEGLVTLGVSLHVQNTESGEVVLKPLEFMTDDECETAARFVCAQLRKRELH